MSVIELFLSGLATAFTPKALLYIAGGVVWGIIGGATPGISASIAMALALPLTFGMDPMYSLPMLSAIYVGAEYGGSIPAILIKTPGTPAAACTAIDGNLFHQRGQGGKALCISLYAGVLGGMIAVLVLIGTVIPLSAVALKFGPTQYFWLAMMGLSIVGVVAGDDPIKGLMSGLFGLFLAVIGRDHFTGIARFTLGLPFLDEGLDLTAVLVGLFAVADTTRQVMKGSIWENTVGKMKKMTYPTKHELASCAPVIGASGILGTFLGALPGAGSTIASWMSYTQAKLLLKDADKTFGTGTDVRAIAAPESANNAVPAGALIPLLALGIPGSNSTAILMAGFSMAGIATGPLLFVNRPEIPYMIMACMFVSQIVLAAVGMGLMKPFIKLTEINKAYLTCAVYVLCLLGAFSTTNLTSSILTLLTCGLIGFVMLMCRFSSASIVLGFVLGELVENNLRRGIQLGRGSVGVFFSGTLNWVLIAITVACIAYPYIAKAIKAKKEKNAAAKA